jgi:hypothetical protein
MQERINPFNQNRLVNKEWGKLDIRGIKMTGNTTYISILTQNVNGLNALIQRHRITNWIKK